MADPHPTDPAADAHLEAQWRRLVPAAPSAALRARTLQDATAAWAATPARRGFRLLLTPLRLAAAALLALLALGALLDATDGALTRATLAAGRPAAGVPPRTPAAPDAALYAEFGLPLRGMLPVAQAPPADAPAPFAFSTLTRAPGLDPLEGPHS